MAESKKVWVIVECGDLGVKSVSFEAIYPALMCLDINSLLSIKDLKGLKS